MDWQPIASAPRNGTWFVIINADDPDSVEVGRYNPLKLHRYEDAGNGLFRKVSYIGCEWDSFNNFHNATHWMPLPAPPKDREKPLVWLDPGDTRSLIVNEDGDLVGLQDKSEKDREP